MRNRKALGKVRPNPGWKPLDPNQKVGHELPPNLKIGEYRAHPPVVQKKTWSRKKKAEVASPKLEGQELGYTPPVDPSGRLLRHRPKLPPPPPPVPRVEKKPPRKSKEKGESMKPYAKLLPGNVSPPGHVWHSISDKTGRLPPNSFASHFGIPLPIDGMTRRPPRPQNREAMASPPSPPMPPRQRTTSDLSHSRLGERKPIHHGLSAGVAKAPIRRPSFNWEEAAKAAGSAKAATSVKAAGKAPARPPAKAPGKAPAKAPPHQNAVASSSRQPSHAKQPEKKPAAKASSSQPGPKKQPEKKPPPADKKGKKRA